MDFHMDAVGLEAVVSELGERARIGTEVRATTQVAARKIRDEARRRIAGHTHLRGYPSTITYETSIGPLGVTAEIGPETGRQGSLGHLIEMGSPTSGPNPHLRPAFDAEVPIWLRYVEQIAGG